MSTDQPTQPPTQPPSQLPYRERTALADALAAAESRLALLRQQAQEGALRDDSTLHMAAVGSAADDWATGNVQRRGRRTLGVADDTALHLVTNDAGFLEWDFGPTSGGARGRRRMRRAGGGAGAGGVIEQSYVIRRIAPNAITAAIRGIDAVLNGNYGLRALDAHNLFAGDCVQPKGKKKRLLIVHGTFSSMKGMLGKAPVRFFRWARDNYEEVLGFDHPSLSVGPVMNAFDLARALRDCEGPLDIVAHSRGGLVVRWLLEGFGAGRCTPSRAVLVGAPLDGTSLAAPFKLQRALSMISNVGLALKGEANPADQEVGQSYFDSALGLAGVVASAIGTHGISVAADAVVAIIPGLLSMARVAGNADLDRLAQTSLQAQPQYFAITSNYVSASPLGSVAAFFSPSAWLNKAKDTAIDAIFPSENDLVVDTESMTLLGNGAPRTLVPISHRFPEASEVNHLNYFAQPKTADLIKDWLV